MRTTQSIATCVVIAAACLNPQTLRAQQPVDSTLRNHQRMLDSLSALIQAMQARIDSLGTPQAAEAAAPAQVRTSGSYMNSSFVGLTDLGWSTEPNVPSLQVGD